MVKSDSISYYEYPWAGGMNSCQFNEIDINLDGVMDLLVFDRMGNRLIPMINTNISDSVSYQYAPEMTSNFPELKDWVIFRDYNLDGKMDIFTYSTGYAGIKVYKNVSVNELEFELVVYPYLKSYQGAGYTNILVTYADYPAIEDMDGDGDLDILTFWGLGSFVEFHKNLGIEKYGTADSLDYEETQLCWGEFAESDESNELYLDTCFGMLSKPTNVSRLPHTGSTFLVNDMDGDNDKDLLLGDVDYPDLFLLINDGSSEYAHMSSFTNIFPKDTRILKLFSMPQASYIDVDNDGVKDLISSPFDPSPYTSENFKSIWYYKNTGQDNMPEFSFVKDNFMQSRMIDLGSGAYPVFFDFTNDGLTDIIVGNYGYYDSSWYNEWMFLKSHYTSKLAAFENIGTESQPVFQLYDRDYVKLSLLSTTGLIPNFADLDSDGDEDMLVGCAEGTLFYFENIATAGQPCNFQLKDTLFQNIDVDEYSAPQFFDLDKDGIKELIIGEKNGNLNYFENNGAEIPQFNLVTDSLGHVLVTDFNVSYYGYSVPCFFYDQDNVIKLLVGSEQGKIFYFEDIEDNLLGYFSESDMLYEILDTVSMHFKEGMRSAAAITDLNQDGTPDMIAGNYSGGLRLYSKMNYQVSPRIRNSEYTEFSIDLLPNPAKQYVEISINGPESLTDVSYELLNMNGLIVVNGNFMHAKAYTLKLDNIKPGLYIIKLKAVTSNQQVFLTSEKLLIISP